MRQQITFKVWGSGFTLFFVLTLVTLMSACGPEPTPIPTATPSVTPSPTPSSSFPPPPVIKTNADAEFGVNWGNSPYTNPPHPLSSPDRTDKAKEAGATWDRWPAYWYWVNQPVRWGEGIENFRWEGDFPLTGEVFNIGEAASADGNELKTLTILDGIPRYYDCAYSTPYSEDHPDGSGCYGETDDRIEGLSQPADAGSPINEANRWATYVYTTVAHLSQYGINHFEIWNEPNLGENYKGGEETSGKWNQMNDPNPYPEWCNEQPACSYVDDYGRMVISTIIAAQRANSNAQLILGAPTSSDEIFVPGSPATGEAGRWMGNAWRYVADRGFDTGLNGIGIHSYGWSFFTPLIAARATEL
ncbi:MAG TPA: hypothetical protein PLH19_16385, partial [Anaerolineae bacterium]|nr:hypothetical protein [Anaerolineae bacterium]